MSVSQILNVSWYMKEVSVLVEQSSSTSGFQMCWGEFAHPLFMYLVTWRPTAVTMACLSGRRKWDIKIITAIQSLCYQRHMFALLAQRQRCSQLRLDSAVVPFYLQYCLCYSWIGSSDKAGVRKGSKLELSIASLHSQTSIQYLNVLRRWKKSTLKEK